MPLRIEDYAVIGNCETVALVGRDGSIDWLCLPRFDSAACFSALLGGPEHGRWLIAPAENDVRITRRYLSNTLILETVFTTAHGSVCSHRFHVQARRLVRAGAHRQGPSGRGRHADRARRAVRLRRHRAVGLVSRTTGGFNSLRARTELLLDTTVQTRGEDFRTVGDFTVREGEEASFVLNWSPSFRAAPRRSPASELTKRCKQVKSFWTGWAAAFKPADHWGDAVLRSLLTLKALAHWETGGIVAAATTSLPEKLGGPRNWDYRYCWLRDATFTLYALIGRRLPRRGEGVARVAFARGRRRSGRPADPSTASRASDGSRNTKFPGCRATKARLRSGSATPRSDSSSSTSMAKCSTPSTSRAARVSRPATRPGRWNARSSSTSRQSGASLTRASGKCAAGRRHFTHSKVMAWVAFDRAVRSIEEFGLDGPLERWRDVRVVNSCRSVRARIRSEAKRVRAVLRRSDAGRESAAHPDRRLSAAGRSPRPRHRRGDRAQAPSRRIGDALRHRRRGRRPAARRRRFPRLQLLAGRQLRAARAVRRSARYSSDCWRCATTSGCWRRNTILMSAVSLATSPRRSRIWRSSTRRIV